MADQLEINEAMVVAIERVFAMVESLGVTLLRTIDLLEQLANKAGVAIELPPIWAIEDYLRQEARKREEGQ